MVLFVVAILAAAKPAATKRPAPAPTIVVVTPQEELSDIDRAYGEAHFELVVPRARKLLASKRLTVLADRDRLERILAFSLFYVDAKADAKEELRALFELNPEADIAARDYPPPLVSFFRETKAEWVSAQGPRDRPASGRQWTEFLPLGIGQFVQHDWLYGAVYAGSEVVLVAGNLSFLFLRLKLRAPDGTYGAKASQAIAFEALQDVAFILAVGVAVVSTIDAWLWCPQRMRQALRLGVVPTANGAALMGEF